MSGKERSVSTSLQLRTFLTLFRGWLGCAFVSMPFGLSQAGGVSAVAILVAASALSAYCAVLLLRCKYEDRDGHVMATYAHVAQRVLGPRGALLLDALVAFCQAGFCISYVIFVLNNLAWLFPGGNPHTMNLMLMALLVSLVVAFSSPTRVSLISTVASIVVIGGLVLCFSAFDWTFPMAYEVPSFRLAGIPLFVGMATGAVCGIGIVLPLEAGMYEQANVRPTLGNLSPVTQAFIRALCWAIGASTLVLISFGLVGSWTYGNATMAVITGNLPDSFVWSRLVRLFLIASLILTFPLQFLPVRTITERYVFPPGTAESEMWVLRVWRGALTILICWSATRIPNFALVYSFVGGSAGCLLSFIFPLTFHLALARPVGSSYVFHLVLLAASFLILIISTVISGRDLFFGP